jgi:acyl dehydratase
MEAFARAFAPGWDIASGVPDAMIYSIWSKLDGEASAKWPQTKRLAVDALRWMRNPPPGELLRGRMTILAKDAVGDAKGMVIAQHDLLDEGGRLVFSCMTRSLFQRADTL